jgi:hypothetical protein
MEAVPKLKFWNSSLKIHTFSMINLPAGRHPARRHPAGRPNTGAAGRGNITISAN